LKTIKNRMSRIVFEDKEMWGPPKMLVCQLQHYADSWAGLACLLPALVLMRRNPAAQMVLALPLVYALMSIGLVHYEPRYVRYTHLSFLFALLAMLAVVWRWGQPRWPRVAVIMQTGLVVMLCVCARRDLLILGRASHAARTTAPAMSQVHHAEGLNVRQAAYLSRDNFRHLVAAPIEAGIFLLESVSYIPEHRSRFPFPGPLFALRPG